MAGGTGGWGTATQRSEGKVQRGGELRADRPERGTGQIVTIYYRRGRGGKKEEKRESRGGEREEESVRRSRGEQKGRS